MTDLLELIDYDSAIDKIVSGSGNATLKFREWLAFNRQELGPTGGELIIENEAAAIGLTMTELKDAADRTSICVKATFWGAENLVQIETFRYDIAEPA